MAASNTEMEGLSTGESTSLLDKLDKDLSQSTHYSPEERQVVIEQFWKSVEAGGGSPVLKKTPDGELTAIFLYRSSESLDITLDCLDLRERLVDKDGHLKQFTKIEGSDVYYLKVENLPQNTCIPYEIEINGKSQADPLNPMQFQLPLFSPAGNTVSLAERKSSVLDIAHVPNRSFWCNNKVPEPQGSVESTVVAGESDDINFGERKCWIYKPPDFNPTRTPPYKMLLVLDGSSYISMTPPWLDDQVAKSVDISNTVVVFVGNVNPESVSSRFNDSQPSTFEAHRQYEYITHGKAFSNFVVNCVIPHLNNPDLDLNVSEKPDEIMLAGFSMSGHCAAETGLHHSDKIGGVILLSPALNNRSGELIEEYQSADKINLRIYVSIGKFEDRVPDDPAVIAESRLEVVRRFAETIRDKG
ncbi:enterobactin/ferric enterobactin esterase [Legionella geestiana]|uniref:Enterobactin/ferric enterobactin esterase n=1 Tax=Legionella geestiana TaxID=45065 RepID=A0A0W0U9V4_9GAMM|nr:alpha/beta hydrolase-fold protein [Legionella geestiana]KTD04412.1 enterobactin/ferric enterobactin esterase [Legionella geestiana]QBS12937.1 hypothetical protein E4T54_09395 [Legionella geestiana]QDQ39382.1 hypothetical protein E3226_002675 [Legionella geestiana]STX54564.1 enterobactin/ferric enterobactin esterase [Legionella geestiana]